MDHEGRQGESDQLGIARYSRNIPVPERTARKAVRRHQHELVDALRKPGGELPRNATTKRVPDQTHSRDAERPHQDEKHSHCAFIGIVRSRVRAGQAESRQVDSNHTKAKREAGRPSGPGLETGGKAVQQEDRRTCAITRIARIQPGSGDVLERCRARRSIPRNGNVDRPILVDLLAAGGELRTLVHLISAHLRCRVQDGLA